jgi:hypothetical protein
LTAISVSSSEIEVLLARSITFGGEGGLDTDSSLVIAPLGFGSSTVITQGEAKVGAQATFEAEMSPHHQVDTHTAEFTTTWTYTTSDDPLLAGRASDVLVVPNLNIQLQKVETISFDTDSCEKSKTTTVKFSIASPANQPAISFLSVKSLEDSIIPKLTTDVENKQKELDNPSNADKKQKLQEQLDELKKAQTRWNDIMLDYNKTNDKNDHAIAAREWFDKWAWETDRWPDKERDGWYDQKKPDLHWSGLVPEGLTRRAVPFDSTNSETDSGFIMPAYGLSSYMDPEELEGIENELQSYGTSIDDLDSMALTDQQSDIYRSNRLHFSGGGSTMEFSMGHTGISELEKAQTQFSLSGGIEGSMEFEANIFGVDADWNIGGGLSFAVNYASTKTVEQDYETSISFALGDENELDEFVVDLFIDPTYGTCK